MTPMTVRITTSIRKGISMGPRASCCMTVRSRLRFFMAASPPYRVMLGSQRYMTPQNASTHITRVIPVNTQNSFTSLQPPISRW